MYPILNLRLYEGKNDSYNLLEITRESLNFSNSADIKQESVLYFGEGGIKGLGGKRTCLNMEKVSNIDVSGLSALLVVNRLNINEGYDKLILSGLQPNVSNLMKKLQLDDIFDCVENLYQL